MNYIGNNISRRIKGMGFFGDYILAKRLQYNHPYAFHYNDDSNTLRMVIDRSIRWSMTPQGSKFWVDIYNKL